MPPTGAQPDHRLTLFGVLRRAWRAWRAQPGLAALVLALLLAQQLFHTYFAYSLKLILDNALRGVNDPPLGLILLSLLLGFAAMVGASLAGEAVTARATAHLLNDLRRRMHTQLLRLSADFYVRSRLGELLTRFGADLKAVEAGYTQAFLNFSLTTFGLLVNLPFLFFLEWRLALVAVITLPLVLAAVRRLLPRSIGASLRLREHEAEVVNLAQETVRAHQVIKSFVLEDWFAGRFDQHLAALHATIIQSRFTMALISKTSSLGVLLIQLLITVMGATLVFAGSLSVGAFVSFITVLSVVTKDVYEFMKKVVPVLIEAAAGVARIEALLDAPVTVPEAPEAVPAGRLAEAIRFEAVTFAYASGQRTLDQVSLTIPAGQFVVFVGASGSGKSTVLSLIMRHYDPQSGAIRLDGVDVRRLTQRSLRAQMGVVFQDNYLFNTSLRENIRLGRPGASDAEIEQAAQAAEIHAFIAGLPEGYATSAGEAGARFSGGQRQRIAIARAILADPAILLLDEATSALDPGTEAAINATLAGLARGRTVIAITHRLQAAQHADQIFVMHNGALVEQGAHTALLAAGGVYAALWQKQAGFEVSQDGRFARVEAGRLLSIDLFARLRPATLQKVANQFRSEYYETGQAIIRQGERGEKFYLIVRGRVAVEAVDSRGQTRFLEYLEDGDHFGEMALLTDQPRNATVTAASPSLFLAMARESLRALIDEHPDIVEALQDRMRESARNLQALEGATEP